MRMELLRPVDIPDPATGSVRLGVGGFAQLKVLQHFHVPLVDIREATGPQLGTFITFSIAGEERGHFDLLDILPDMER